MRFVGALRPAAKRGHRPSILRPTKERRRSRRLANDGSIADHAYSSSFVHLAGSSLASRRACPLTRANQR